MSTLPHSIDDKALPTPTHEWANDTETALNSDPITAPEKLTAPLLTSHSSHGHDFPGAFPRGQDATSKPENVGMFDTARQYIPGQQEVGNALLSASETAKQYLPESVASYLPASPPSSSPTNKFINETKVYQGGGVGSLPGSSSELGVAILPEERMQENSKANATPSKLSNVISGTGIGTDAPTGGVGSLPGSSSEVGVAMLPEERAQGQHTPSKLSNEAALGDGAGFNSIGHKADVNSPQPPPPIPFINPARGDFAVTPHADNSISNISTQAQDGSATSTTRTLSDTPIPGGATPPPLPLPGSVASHGAGGVGDLPGDDSESGVMVLPEEKNVTHDQNKPRSSQDRVLRTTARTHPLAMEGAKWKGVPLSEPYQKALDEDEDRQLNIGAPTKSASLHSQGTTSGLNGKEEKVKDEVHAVKDKVMGAATNGHSAQTDPKHRDAKAGSANGGLSDNKDVATNGAAAQPTTVGGASKESDHPLTNTASKGSGSAVGSPTKTSFIDKLKGEAKIISGKLGKNESKIEEGKRMMGKA